MAFASPALVTGEMDQPAPEWGGFATLIVALTAGVSERYAAEPKSVLNRCVRILTKGKEND